MAYPVLTNLTDIMDIFVYINQSSITGGWAMPLIIVAFFLVVFLGGLMAQQKITGTFKVQSNLLAASFVTVGFEVILMQKNLVNGYVFMLTMFALIGSFFWLVLSSAENPPGM